MMLRENDMEKNIVESEKKVKKELVKFSLTLKKIKTY